jgi:hypothetical protein
MMAWQRGLRFLGLALALAVVLTGCGPKLTSENLEKVKNGMTQQEVRSILGKPTREETANLLGLSGTTWVYEQGGAKVTLSFVNDGVIHKEGTFQ